MSFSAPEVSSRLRPHGIIMEGLYRSRSAGPRRSAWFAKELMHDTDTYKQTENIRLTHYRLLACDYDDTIASQGHVAIETMLAMDRFRAAGRKVVLVTGRELEDLRQACPRLTVFDRVVAENGAVLHDPLTQETRNLATPPPSAFVEELTRQGVTPISTGRVIVATLRPQQPIVARVIRELGLELDTILNRDSLMVLPRGVDKGTGLAAALQELGEPADRTVAVGDAENDFGFLRLCGCTVAVANAVPTLKAHANVVTKAGQGKGVAELIAAILGEGSI